MTILTPTELAYLSGERRLGRLATVGLDGMPHIAPVGWTYNAVLGTLDIGGRDLARTKKFRDVARSGMAAIVVDDVLPAWRPRGIEVRGTAEVIRSPDSLIRLHPRRVVSWGLDSDDPGARHARDVSAERSGASLGTHRTRRNLLHA